MERTIEYRFQYVEKCTMCGSGAKNQQVMGRRLNRAQGRNPSKKAGISTTVMKCSDCGLIYANPLPVPINIQSHYGIPPEEYWKEHYFELNDSYFLQQINTLRTLMKIEPGHRDLDVGAGIGKCLKALEKAGFDSFGLEPSEPFYAKAIEKMGISPAKLQLASVENAEYPPDYFHFISFSAVLEHLYEPSAAIEKALKWIKPNGIIHIEVPSSAWLVNKLINSYYRLTGLDYVGNISPMHIPFHLYEFGLESFLKNGEKNNYEIVEHEYFVCQTYLPKVLDIILESLMEYTHTGMQIQVWLRKK